MSKKKRKKKEEAEVHEDLKGFNIRIDPFGKLESNLSIDEIKKFLDDKIDDKRVKHVDKSEEE